MPRTTTGHDKALEAACGAGSYEWRPAEDRLIWSPGLIRVYGVTQAPETEEGFSRLVHPEDRVRVEAETSAYLGSDAESFSHSFRIVRPDGCVRFILDRGAIERDEQGVARVVRGLNIDLTDEPYLNGRTMAGGWSGFRQVEDVNESHTKGNGVFEDGKPVQMAGIDKHTRAEEALRASEQHYRALFEHMLDGAAYCQMLFDDHGRPDDFVYLAVNEAFGGLTGLKDVIGKRVTQVIPRIKELNSELFEIYGRVASTGGPEKVEIDFKPLGLHLSISVYSPARGFFVAVFDDITARKQAGNALRESEARLQAVLDSSPDPIFLKDREGRQMLANPAMFAAIGKPAQACLGKTDEQFLDNPADGRAIMATDRRIMASGQAETVEETIFTPLGTRHFVSNKAPFRDAAGNVIGLIGSARDVTGLKQAEKALRESEERLRSIAGLAQVGHWHWDLAADRLEWSPLCRHLFSIPPEEPMSYARFLAALHPEDCERTGRAVRACLESAGQRDYDIDYRTMRPDGTVRWLHAKGNAVFEDGKPVRMAGIVIDVTERKRAEEALCESEERFRALTTASADIMYRMNPDWSEMRALDGHGFLSSTLTPTQSWLDQYILAADQPYVLQAIAQSVRTKTIFDLKHRVRRAGGGIGWTHSRAVPLLNSDDEIREWFGAATDITSQIEAEESLRRNAETFAALVEQSPLGIYTVNSQFRIRNVSAGAMPAFRNVRPLIGRDFGEVMRILWPESFASEAIGIFRRTLETGEPYVSQGLTEERNDIGTSKSYEWQVNRVTLTDGQYGVVCYFYDTTRLQQAYQAVRESEERLRFSLHAASAGAWEWDILSDKNTWSPENHALLDVEPGADNPTYAHWEARIHPEDREAANQQVRDVLEGREAEFRAEFRVVRRDGSVRWLAGFGKVERDADGVALRMSGINIDITERKRDEEHIQLLMREVNHRSKNLLSLVQAIAHRTASTGAQDFIQRFGERIQSLAAAQDLLIRHAWKAVPLEALVCSQLSHFADLIGTRIVIAGPALWINPAASQALGMALHELATNAVKYGALSNKSGRVDISWYVSASGAAEPKLTMSWVEQGGPPVAKPLRRGFGSTVISRMVEGSVGGEVSVDYARAGLVWRLSCPSGNTVEGRLPSTVIEAPRACAGGGGRVLVVEDEPLIAAEIATTLELAGFKIIGPASSVSHALALMNGDGCDAAVLDVNLGHETSEPIARELMSDGKPFVVVSGYARAQLPQVLRAAPLVGKPLSPSALEAEVKRLVETAAPRQLHS